MAAEKVLETLMAAVDRLNVKIATHPFASGLIEGFVTDAQRRGARPIAGSYSW